MLEHRKAFIYILQGLSGLGKMEGGWKGKIQISIPALGVHGVIENIPCLYTGENVPMVVDSNYPLSKPTYCDFTPPQNDGILCRNCELKKTRK